MWCNCSLFLLAAVFCLQLAQIQSTLKDNRSIYSYRGKLSSQRTSLLGRRLEETGVEGETEDDEDQTPPSPPASTSNTAEIQWMITSKMRKILTEDLGYLDAEVDDMEPQIASVVIERNLARPTKGMPDSWRRSGVDKPTSSPLHRWKTQLVEAFRKAWDRSKEYIVPVLPALLVSTAIWYQRESLNIIFSTIWKSISSIRLWKTKGNQQQVEVKVPKRKNRFMFGGNNAKEEEFVRKIKAPRVKVNRVDVLNLEGARKKSLWDKLALKFAIWKRN